jgi:hypothetical protein
MLSLNAADAPKAGVIKKIKKRLAVIHNAIGVFIVFYLLEAWHFQL